MSDGTRRYEERRQNERRNSSRRERRELGEPIIVFEDAWKAFGPVSIYEGLDLTIHRGETLTIIGGSGTGKSVLLKCLLRLLQLDKGTIKAFGETVTGRSEGEMLPIRRRIGMLFQGAALFDSLNVFENVAYPLRQHAWGTNAEITDRVEWCLEQVNMPGVERKWPSELSGGMKKRVGLARAIAMEPEVILYDEPTTGLDPTNVRVIDALILALQERLKVTSVVVTHDMDSAFRVSDRIAMLWQRRIDWVGYTGDVWEAENPIVRNFVNGDIEWD
jgi:phospholipid/cholesterol/gamma-HCH transport system ATP-binding protein